MFPILNQNKKKKNIQISAGEAFNLWDILNSVYTAIEKFNLWSNYVHDSEFEILMQLYLKEINMCKNLLEKALTQFGMKAPDSHTLTVSTELNSDFMRDQLIAIDLFTTLQEHIDLLLLAIAHSTRNDKVRSLLMQFVKKNINKIDLTTKFLKAKGWLQAPPMYSQIPAKTLKIDAGEAFNLWSHLTYRYDNLLLTETFMSLANDGDLKLYLRKGQGLLTNQARAIERELQHFGIVIPIKPAVTIPPNPHHAVDDDSIFRVIFSGISGALTVHSNAIKQSTTNDRIRKLFIRLLLDELDALDVTIRFGKLKGWLHPAPTFREY